MTPDEIDWPPPICDACRNGFCEHCLGGQVVCEHLDCPWLYDEEAE